ncbi:MAG: hypothetical protein QNJ46_12350 [Leptolyngbyaceae cyanobacterium MO_188.B28]|nr:hypothetical protein [Leptolyngbyaceae cyanobacterium MO_188.B28]
MKTSRSLLPVFITLSLLLGGLTHPATAAQTPEPISNQTTQFRHVEQPVFRIGLSLGGFALIGLLISSVIDNNQATSLDHKPM